MKQISEPTISRDLAYLIQQAKSNIKRYIDERLLYEKCLAWATQQTEDRREKIQALSLAKDCYSMKLDLLTTVVDDAIRFVSKNNHENEKTKSKSNNTDTEEEEITTTTNLY